jgi:glycyl-tRNA synthetase beta chain
VLPEIILAIPFPKRMRWADLTISFARPIHSLLALYGGSPIGFTLGRIRSGRTTFGHRFMHPRPIKVAEPAAYVEALRSGFVIVDPAERRRLIAEGAAQAAVSVGGHVLPDEELLGTVTQLVEYPAIAVGRFCRRLPGASAEVLITAMREHQKYFAVVDPGETPAFHCRQQHARPGHGGGGRGHERVLRPG